VVYGHILPDIRVRTHYRFALGLVRFRFRLDIILNPFQDVTVGVVSEGDNGLEFTRGITGSTAGLSLVNGVRRSSAET